MAKKPRKTNIHIESRVITYVKPAYNNPGEGVKKIVYNFHSRHTSLLIESLSTNIYFRLYVGGVLHPVYTDDWEDYQDVPKGFHTSFFINPEIGTSIKIEAYRIGEGKHIQDYKECLVGFCSGFFTEQGFLCETKDNVSTQEKDPMILQKTKY